MVRRSVGYFRYDTKHELELLNQLWPLVSTQVNLFLPQQRLLSKTRTGARVKKTYDIATTPAARIQRDHPDLLDPADQKLIDTRLTETDLITLKTQITLIQANLTELARRRGPVKRRGKTQTTFNNRQKIAPTKRAKPDESTNHTSRAS